MNNFELQEYIKEKSLENPFLVEKHNLENHFDLTEKLRSKDKLQDEIFKEISFSHFDDSEKEITEILVNNIEDEGYLSGELLKYISQEKGISYLNLLKIIHKLKKTPFASMFAFNLQDKLKTFLENENLYSPNYEILIKNIDIVFSDDWSLLKSRYGFRSSELFDMISVLKNAFLLSIDNDNNCSPHKRIDLIMEEKYDNEFRISLDETTSTKVAFDNKLYVKSAQKCRSESDKTYIKNNASNAKLLIKSVGFRSITLLKVVNEITHRQKDFFSGKDPCLIPVSTKSIAYSLFLHESTVNRAVLNKSIATPRGIFELRSLLPREIKSCESRVSDHSIKEYMKTLIKNEPKNDPYSDNHIVSFLDRRGINISRRTVSKYRDILNIPNLTERLKIYKIAANIWRI
jgi:RNA polymerase sigma-54 factor